jgi:DNA-binding response OmpR family regulator
MPARRPVILCIDDYENALVGRQMLLEEEGYEVLTAADGRNGLQLFMSYPVDEVILDYEMPGLMGDETAVQMKRLKQNVPILLLSGDSWLPEDKLKPVDAFLSKMEPIKVFLAIVKTLLSTPSLADRLDAGPQDASNFSTLRQERRAA